MTQKTILNEAHRIAGARMVDFGGWDMPLNYGSQIDEHHLVRNDAGMFDVSHMTVVDLRGAECRPFLRQLLANNIDKLKVSGKALYTCMLNQQGGVIDDLIVYFMQDDFFRLVVNAATREKDLAWISEHANAFGVVVSERRELAMIAVQGPQARAKFHTLINAETRAKAERLTRFSACEGNGLFIARTGYTGEDGYEIVMPEADAVSWWNRLLDAGVKPAGLGARDTLRLEAGMNLYGQDMDETTSPYEAGLAWTVALEPMDREFIGRGVLLAQKALINQNQINQAPRQMIGLVMDEKGVLRHGQLVTTKQGRGEILSGTFSPSLGKAIAFARVPAGECGNVTVDIRGKQVSVRVVKFPFVRDGKSCDGIDI